MHSLSQKRKTEQRVATRQCGHKTLRYLILVLLLLFYSCTLTCRTFLALVTVGFELEVISIMGLIFIFDIQMMSLWSTALTITRLGCRTRLRRRWYHESISCISLFADTSFPTLTTQLIQQKALHQLEKDKHHRAWRPRSNSQLHLMHLTYQLCIGFGFFLMSCDLQYCIIVVWEYKVHFKKQLKWLTTHLRAKQNKSEWHTCIHPPFYKITIGVVWSRLNNVALELIHFPD